MNGMKKTGLVLLIMLLAVAAWGCKADKDESDGKDGQSGQTKSAFDSLWEEAPKGVLAVLINLPSTEQEKDFPAKEKLVLERTDERFLLIPGKDVEQIAVWNLEFNNADFVRTNAVYENYGPEENFVLDMTVMRPEGGPHFELVLSGKGKAASYYISYNGKDGNPNIEYIFAE